MKVWLVGGGTAGHVLPLSALASELRVRKHDSVLVIDRGETAARIVSDGGEWGRVVRLTCGKLRRYQGRGWVERLTDWKTLLLNIRDIFLVIIGFSGALWWMFRDSPDVVFINGGAIGVPVAWAARFKGVPYLIHESDVESGLANRMISGNANRILLGLADNNAEDEKRIFVVGIPQRPEFVSIKKVSTAKLKQTYGFDPKKPVLLITGGSQGSEKLNKIAISQAVKLLDFTQVIHIAGQKHQNLVTDEIKGRVGSTASYRVFGFVGPEMADFLRMAEVVISRSGATILSDLAYLGKAAVLIPNPQLERHQGKNAATLAKADAALVLDESTITNSPGLLTDAISELLKDNSRRKSMEKAISSFSRPNATESIVDHIVSVGQKGHK